MEVEKTVRGGIVADQVGYGKTAISIGVILSNQIAFPSEKESAVLKPVRAIPTRATLVVVPSQLIAMAARSRKIFREGHLEDCRRENRCGYVGVDGEVYHERGRGYRGNLCVPIKALF